jgi:hypothetical protein
VGRVVCGWGVGILLEQGVRYGVCDLESRVGLVHWEVFWAVML